MSLRPKLPQYPANIMTQSFKQSEQTTSWHVAALYKFVRVADCPALKEQLDKICIRHHIKGTLLVAYEGLNGTIAAAEKSDLVAALTAIRNIPGFENLDFKTSTASEPPFPRLKVRLKKEIVTMGVGDLDPAVNAGTYVKPEDWNALISDPDTITIDTRNDYEYAIGTFKGAIDPETVAFRDFPDWVEKNHNRLGAAKKIAMFCTGGIRCEKSTAYMKKLGYDEVYHLEGGILKYLENVPKSETMWEGNCFVFDERVSVGHGLVEGHHTLCRACRRPLTPAELLHPAYEEGVSCQYCIDSTAPAKQAGFRERQKQIKLAKERGEVHMGSKPPRNLNDHLNDRGDDNAEDL